MRRSASEIIRNLETRIARLEQQSSRGSNRLASKRYLSEIAYEIHNDWRQQRGGIYFGAKPYLEAMFSLRDIDDTYGVESARSIVLYFLSNATKWKGPVAKRVKAELKKMVK